MCPARLIPINRVKTICGPQSRRPPADYNAISIGAPLKLAIAFQAMLRRSAAAMLRRKRHAF